MKQTNDRKNATNVIVIINVGITEDKELLVEELKKLKQKDSLVRQTIEEQTIISICH